MKKIEWLLHPFKLERKLRLLNITKSPSWLDFMMSHKKEALNMAWELSYGNGKGMNWDNPQTLNEKIQWLEAYTDTSIWTEYSDKIKVRKHVEKVGLGDILIPFYGSWKRFEDIDFEQLPKSFVLKCNHDSGSAVIIHDKSKIDYENLRIFFDVKVSKPFGLKTVEPHYVKIDRRIMAEQLIGNGGGELKDNTSGVTDYKFWCINGEPLFVFLAYDRVIAKHEVFDIYSLNPWEPQHGWLSPRFRNAKFRYIPRPHNLDKMLEIARLLAKDFPEVRIDLYNIEGIIYFGEMTFTSFAGRMDYFSDEMQFKLGSLIKLPKVE